MIGAADPDEGLLRAVGTGGLAASIVNAVIAAGIFALPASLARCLGDAAPIAYLISAVIVGLVTVAVSRAGRRVARSGGLYAFAEAAFGSFPGYLTGVVLWL